jgi:septal ring factor EnvC (AmiA/AmiB activator)
MLASETEYAKLREEISSVLKANKAVKTELNVLQAALKHENDLDADNHCRKEEARRTLAKTSDELQWQRSKEDQLLLILRERRSQEAQAEECYKHLDHADLEANQKMNQVEPELLYHRKMLGFLEHDLPEA